MSAEEWYFQLSPKLSNGELVNVRGKDAAHFLANLEAVTANADAIVAAARALQEADRANRPTVAAPVQAAPAAYAGGDAVDQAVQAVQSVIPGAVTDEKYQCPHGARVMRTSKPGAARQWTGYFCPTPKDTPGQCKPVFQN